MKPVTIDWDTAEFFAIVGGHTDYGNAKRRAAANADLGNAMGNKQMDTSLDCFNLKLDKAIGKDIAERKAILRFINKNYPGNESLVTAIENGEHNKKEK